MSDLGWTFARKSDEEIDRSFDKIRISIASPDMIESWSYGEVKRPETINYRTFKPERGGLFCAKIFGPVKDYECLCGKYKRIKYKGVVCEHCGVEVTLSRVRRERMGHISLASPVAHVWFLKSLPSRMSMILDIPLKHLEAVLYFEKYIVLESALSPLSLHQLLSEEEYAKYKSDYAGTGFKAMIGAEAIHQLLASINLEEEILFLREEMKVSNSEAKRKKYVKRLKILEAFYDSKTDPSWMVLSVIPVMPPELRPLVPLDGGRFASSDLNDLYRRVVNRNNRLARLIEWKSPEIILKNEKRMLQEAVDALFDNGRRGRVLTALRRPLKSISDMLKGKQGRFRQNLLGKRVDYSGRSVIVVGPDLMLHQCGIPKKMALELFKPFIYSKLETLGLAATIKSAKRLVEMEIPEVWDILEDLIREHPVLLNRAPTLHRLSIQAFEPKLVEGKAIQLHPLVCTAFNADFDGDQMAVHVPLSLEAQLEARVLMMSTNNILSPANGKPIIIPSQDIILGLYYMTLERPDLFGDIMLIDPKDIAEYYELWNFGFFRVKSLKTGCVFFDLSFEEFVSGFKLGEYSLHKVPVFRSVGEMEHALYVGSITVQSPILMAKASIAQDVSEFVRYVPTTVGRVILADILPKTQDLPFSLVNKVMTKKEVSHLLDVVYRRCGQRDTVVLCDRLMSLGFRWACRSGISIGKDDMIVPEEKKSLVDASYAKVKEYEYQYLEGLITQGEKYNKIVDVWSACTDDVAEAMMNVIATDGFVPGFNSVYMMARSGARGSAVQIKQLAGMRGLMAKPDGSIIETPILSNFKEGLTVLEYFNSTHGARKGLADTALKTANSGYLTRRLVDVAQDCIIFEHDCGTEEGIVLSAVVLDGEEVDSLGERVLGRCSLRDLRDPHTGETLVSKGQLIDEMIADKITASGLTEVAIRSVLMCQSKKGLCAKCYGRDLARGSLVNIGEAVGIIAAQSIGEPGTQLTMRTFHIGGAAQRGAERSSIEAPFDGIVQFENESFIEDSLSRFVVMNRSTELIVLDVFGKEKLRHRLPYGSRLSVASGHKVKAGQILAEWDPYTLPIVSERDGIVSFSDLEVGVALKHVFDEGTGVSRQVVMDWKQNMKGVNLRPSILLKDEKGDPILLSSGEARYFLSPESVLSVVDGASIKAGDVLARIPRGVSKTRDITGGLPRVAELFEARKPKDFAIIADQDGYVEFGRDYKMKRRLLIKPVDTTAEVSEFLIPKGKHVIVQEGDFVRKGEVLMDGSLVPHWILDILGVEALASYLISEIQDVYRLQGVRINDKHIEIIVRQMLQKVEVIDPGDTYLLVGEQIDRQELEELNRNILQKSMKPAKVRSVLQGITKASLQTRSFISAASFQETVRVLTDAAVGAKIDNLIGLKENVIVGRTIPAGTGYLADCYRKKALKEMNVGGGA